MPLVTPLSADHDLETKELAAFFNETLGFCPNSVLTMQRRPAISKAFINLNKAVMANEGRVTSALKRMIAWVSSNATGCRYCQAHAIRAAERYGAEQEQLDNIWEYRTHPAKPDNIKALGLKPSPLPPFSSPASINKSCPDGFVLSKRISPNHFVVT